MKHTAQSLLDLAGRNVVASVLTDEATSKTTFEVVGDNFEGSATVGDVSLSVSIAAPDLKSVLGLVAEGLNAAGETADSSTEESEEDVPADAEGWLGDDTETEPEPEPEVVEKTAAKKSSRRTPLPAVDNDDF